MAQFKARTTCPNSKDKYYVRKGYKTSDGVDGINPCIKGSPEKWTGSVLANCVGYAWGRAAEILDHMFEENISGTLHLPDTGNVPSAKWWIDRAAKYGWTVEYGPNAKPFKGAIACWSNRLDGIDNAGHLAIVEDFGTDSEGDWIKVSDSYYHGAAFNPPDDRQLYKKEQLKPDSETEYQIAYCTDSWKDPSLRKRFQGFIYITEGFVENPDYIVPDDSGSQEDGTLPAPLVFARNKQVFGNDTFVPGSLFVYSAGSKKWSPVLQAFIYDGKRGQWTATHIWKSGEQSNQDKEEVYDASHKLVFGPGQVRICTDGSSGSTSNDATWQGATAATMRGGPNKGKYLDAYRLPYVVQPLGEDSLLYVKALVVNKATGNTIEAVVGDRGPKKNRWGEVSMYVINKTGYPDHKSGNYAPSGSNQYEIYLLTDEKGNYLKYEADDPFWTKYPDNS